MAENKATQDKPEDKQPPKAEGKPPGSTQVSLALANLVSGGMSLKEARKRLGE